MKKSMKSHAAADGELPIERVPARARQMLRAAKSLRPGQAFMEAVCMKSPEALLILDAWKPKLPIRTVSPEEFADICERGATIFHG